MEANVRALEARDPAGEARARYDQVAQWLTGNAGARAAEGIAWLNRLCADLGIPGLRSYGLRPEHVPLVVTKARQASSMKANPVALTEDELTEVLSRAL
jgi:alcohol dehydrogenase class IV